MNLPDKIPACTGISNGKYFHNVITNGLFSPCVIPMRPFKDDDF